MVSIVVTARMAEAASRESAEILRFSRGETVRRTHPGPAPASMLAIRLHGGDHRRGEVVGCLMTSHRAVSLPDGGNGDVFLIHSLRVSPDLGGFSPGVHRTMIAHAVARLAWTEADNDDTSAMVAIRVRSTDQRVYEDMRILRARKLGPDMIRLHALDDMGEPDIIEPLAQYWEVTPDMARQCAKLVSLPTEPAVRFDRDTNRLRQLHMELDMRWLDVGRIRLQQIAEGSDVVDWAQFDPRLIENGMVRRMVELPDGDDPFT